VDSSRHYYYDKERCIFCDMIRQELDSGVRVIPAKLNYSLRALLTAAAVSVRDVNSPETAQLLL